MTVTATAALLDGVGDPFRVAQVELDEPRAREVLVRVVGCGICHSDLQVQSGGTPSAFPALLGHEGAGVVEAVGSEVASLAVGDHVVLQSASCGRCDRCRGGRPGHCRSWLELNLLHGHRPDGSVTVRRDGQAVRAHFFGQSSMASHALADERTAVKVDADLDLLRVLGPLGCSVQTGAQAVLNVLRPQAGAVLVVMGAGAVGLSAVMAAASLTAARTIAVDVRPGRLELARELGAEHVVDARGVEVAEAIRELTGGRGCDFVLETSGAPDALPTAVASLDSLGTCGVISARSFDAEARLRIVPLIAEGISLVGINQGEVLAQESIPALLALHRAGRLPFDRLVRTYPLADVEQAAADARSGATVKPVLVMP